MSSIPISSNSAEVLNARLLQISGLLNEVVGIADETCEAAFSKHFRHQIAQAMTIIGWDVLEGMIYLHHSHLRPYSVSLPEGSTD